MNREIAAAVSIALGSFGAGHYAGDVPQALVSAVTLYRRDDGDDQQFAVQDGPENEFNIEVAPAPLPVGPVPTPYARNPWQFWDEAAHAQAGAAMMQMRMARNGALLTVLTPYEKSARQTDDPVGERVLTNQE